MWHQQKINYEKFLEGLEVDTDYYIEYFNNNYVDEDSFESKMKKMAIEVINSFIGDILSVKQIKKYCKSLNGKISYHKKSMIQMKLDRHINAVDWFNSGEACNSIWFKILNWENIGKKRLIDLVNKKIEGYE